MKRFVWNAAQSGRILRQHRMLALFLILQCALCLGMAGTVANQAVQSGPEDRGFSDADRGKAILYRIGKHERNGFLPLPA